MVCGDVSLALPQTCHCQAGPQGAAKVKSVFLSGSSDPEVALHSSNPPLLWLSQSFRPLPVSKVSWELLSQGRNRVYKRMQNSTAEKTPHVHPLSNSLACPRVLRTIIHHDRLFPKQMGNQPTPMTRSFNLHHDKMHWPRGSCKSSSSEWPHHNHFSPQDSTAPKREGKFKHEHEPATSPGPRGVEAAAQAPRPAEELVLLSNT